MRIIWELNIYSDNLEVWVSNNMRVDKICNGIKYGFSKYIFYFLIAWFVQRNIF